MAFVKIANLFLYDYNLLLNHPIELKGHPLGNRRGCLLKMVSDKRRGIFADVAPLPYFHKESLEDIKECFSEIKERLIGTHWSLQLLLKEKHILMDLPLYKKYPSLFFAIEFALLCHLMPKFNFFQDIKINALLAGSDEEILSKASLLKERRAIKVKAGRREPHEMLMLMEKLAKALPGHKFRVDINRAWPLDKTRAFCKKFPIELCEYLEEPLKNPLDFLTFSNEFLHPIAFDESILDTPLEFLLSVPTKAAFIIKPTLIGSLQKINQLYSKAELHGLKFILTSAFESGLGHLMIAHLAHFLGIEDPIGLDTYHWLKNDVLSKKLVLFEGVLNLKENHLLNPYVDMKALKLST